MQFHGKRAKLLIAADAALNDRTFGSGFRHSLENEIRNRYSIKSQHFRAILVQISLSDCKEFAAEGRLYSGKSEKSSEMGR